MAVNNFVKFKEYKVMTDQQTDYWQRALDVIHKHGFAVQHVMAGQDPTIDPSLSYTVGLSSKGLPELITIGLYQEAAHEFLNTIANRMVDGVLKADDGTIVIEVANLPLCLKSVDLATAGEYAFGSCRFAGEHGYPLSFLQVVFPDAKGIFSWQAGCDPAMAEMQHLQKMLPDSSAPIDRSKLH